MRERAYAGVHGWSAYRGCNVDGEGRACLERKRLAADEEDVGACRERALHRNDRRVRRPRPQQQHRQQQQRRRRPSERRPPHRCEC